MIQLIISILLFSQDPGFNTEFYSESGVCPFEGCMFGEWSTKKEVTMYSEPEIKTEIGQIPKSSKFEALDDKINIVPGIAYKTEELPSIGYTESITDEFSYDEPIYILHYVGEGFNKVYHQGEFNYLQFPRDKEIYDTFQQNYDWLRIERYPKDFEWWVKVKFEDKMGWILVDQNVQPLDRFN